MVSIQYRHTIIPSSATPNTKLFSLCEQIKLPTHAPLLYVYKPQNYNKNKTSLTFIETLRNSLSQALVIYYPLAGRLSWIIKGGRWELHCNAKGAHLLEAKCEEIEKLEALGDFVPTHLVSQLIPNIDYNLPIEEIPLLSVQLTRFRCGGLTIGVALCRAAIDGTSTMRFMDTWAKLARGEPLDPIEMPLHDRTLLNLRKQTNSGFLQLHPHCEFHAPPLWVGGIEDTTKLVVASVKLTQEQVVKLKKKAGDSTMLLTREKPYSTFEVVAGHLWKCVTKSRYVGNGDQPTRLSTLVNCRNRLKPHLPSTYAGNAAFPTVTSTRSFHELMHKPLSYAVENVKEAIEKVTGEFVISTLDYIERQNDMNLLRYNFHYPAIGSYKGNPNLFVVSWMNFPYKDADFGWGKPIYFGPGYMDSEGKAFVLNDGNGDGVVVVICLEASHMDVFKKVFYDDIDMVFHTSKL